MGSNPRSPSLLKLQMFSKPNANKIKARKCDLMFPVSQGRRPMETQQSSYTSLASDTPVLESSPSQQTTTNVNSKLNHRQHFWVVHNMARIYLYAPMC